MAKNTVEKCCNFMYKNTAKRCLNMFFCVFFMYFMQKNVIKSCLKMLSKKFFLSKNIDVYYCKIMSINNVDKQCRKTLSKNVIELNEKSYQKMLSKKNCKQLFVKKWCRFLPSKNVFYCL